MGCFGVFLRLGMDEPPKGLRMVKVTDKGEVRMIRSTLFHLYIVLGFRCFQSSDCADCQDGWMLFFAEPSWFQ